MGRLPCGAARPPRVLLSSHWGPWNRRGCREGEEVQEAEVQSTPEKLEDERDPGQRLRLVALEDVLPDEGSNHLISNPV